MNKLKILSFLLLFFVFTSTFAQERRLEKSASLKVRIIEKAKHTQTIQSSFEQLKHLSFLTKDIRSSGNLTFKAPNLIKWVYDKPFNYSVVFKDNKLYINDSGDKSMVDAASNKAFKSLNRMIVKSVSGDLFDKDEFDFEFFENTTEYLVHFKPKSESMKQFVQQIVLSFDKRTLDVVQIKLLEGEGDYTQIRFFDQQINKPVNDAVFTN